MNTQTELTLETPIKAESGAAVGVQPLVSPSPVTDYEIAMFAAMHLMRVEYGTPTIVHWMDKRGNHTTIGANTRSATINALLEWRDGANTPDITK